MASPASALSIEEDKVEFARNESMEEVPFLKQNGDQPRWTRPSRIPLFTKIMAGVNVILAIILAISVGILAAAEVRCPQHVQDLPDPYSPALGAVVPVIRKFKPELIFQSETSDLVEKAWNKSLGPFEGVVVLDAQESAKMAKISHESVASVWEPDKRVYGISMYHQMHCLNVIRQSFYREKFFPNKTDDEFNFHKNHCFDFLRQVILCHGDVSLTYWWNKNFTGNGLYDGGGHSEHYESLSIKQRAKQSFVNWDIEHKCRMVEPIDEWVTQNRPYPKGVNIWADPPDPK